MSLDEGVSMRGRLMAGLAASMGLLGLAGYDLLTSSGRQLNDHELARIRRQSDDDYGTVFRQDMPQLFYRAWKPENAKAVVLALPPLQLNSETFRGLGGDLAWRGVACYAMDLRGAGLSAGLRWDVVDLWTMVDDVVAMLDGIKARQPEAPIYLLGQGMGAALALETIHERHPRIAGLIMVAPPWRVPPHRRAFPPSALPRLVSYGVLAKGLPAVPLGMPEFALNAPLSGDQVRRMWQDDALATNYVSPRTVHALHTLVSFDTMREHARSVDLPTLIVTGEQDPGRDAAAVIQRDLRTDSRLVEIPQADAYPFHCPGRHEAAEIIAGWVVGAR